jgi:hypothetical protein
VSAAGWQWLSFFFATEGLPYRNFPRCGVFQLRKWFSEGHPHLYPLPEGEEVDFWIYEGVLLDRKDSLVSIASGDLSKSSLYDLVALVPVCVLCGKKWGDCNAPAIAVVWWDIRATRNSLAKTSF